MTIVELGAARHQEEGGVDYYTVHIAEHKIGKSERLKIAYEKDLHPLLQRWMKVREAVIPPECLPNFWGCILTDPIKAGFNIITFQHHGLFVQSWR